MDRPGFPTPALAVALLVLAALAWILWDRRLGGEESGEPLTEVSPAPGPPDPAPFLARPPREALRGHDPARSFVDRPPVLDELSRPPGETRPLLYGTVRSVEGEILAGARVSAYAGWDQASERVFAPLAESYSDGVGRYEIPLEEPVPVWIEAEAEGFAPGRLSVLMDRPAPVRRDLTLQPADSWIVGRVTELLSGQPLAGGTVSGRFVSVPSPGAVHTPIPTFHARSDGDGFFRLGPVPVGRVDLTASLTGYLEDIQSVVVSEPGSRLQVELRPAAAQEVVLNFRDPEGAPVSGVQVQRPDGYVARGGEDGIVRFPILPGVSEIRCKVEAPGFLTRWLQLSVPVASHGIVLERGTLLEGSVANPQGLPLEGARVWISGSDPVGRPHREGATLTDEAGRFSFHLSNPPLREVEVARDGYVRGRRVFGPEERLDLDFRLEPARTGIAGRVLDERGRPVPSFVVVVRSRELFAAGSPPLIRSFEDPNGVFSILELDSGHYSIEVRGRRAGDGVTLMGSVSRLVLTRGFLEEIVLQLEEPPTPPPPLAPGP